MVAATGRRSECRRRASGQRLAVAVVAVRGRPRSTEPSGGGSGLGDGGVCLAILECLIGVVRALGMGSCLSLDGSAASTPAGRRPRRGGSRRRSSADAKREERFRGIPGRMAANGASGAASLFTQQGKKGINQDAMTVWENFGSRTDTIFCGVFDGHGPHGHLVAKRVRDLLPLKMGADLENDDIRESTVSISGSINPGNSCGYFEEEETKVSAGFEEREKKPDMIAVLKESFMKAFKVIDWDLRQNANIDCFFSGTTAVTLVKQGRDIIIGNVGDSRAVLGTRNEDGCLVSVQLTVDLKPNLPREAERIRRCRGRVFALRDEPEVARVWLPNLDSPGLAMARAFGDFCLKDFGLISVPEIYHRRITEKDEFIILATDGVWDVLTNDEVVSIVGLAPSQSSAARTLVESAVRAWRLKYPTSKIDDCAVVCLHLNTDEADNSSGPKDDDVCKSIDAAEGSDMLSSPTDFSRSSTIRHGIDNSVDGTSAPVTERDEWSALEGVSRANTLLTLPRSLNGAK